MALRSAVALGLVRSSIPLVSFFLIKFIGSETLTKCSFALGSTTLEPEREDPLGMKATVVGHFFIVGIVDTLVEGTVLSSMTSPVHETICQDIPHLHVVVESKISGIIMFEESVHFSVGVRRKVSSMEGLLERVEVGGERRHWWSVIRQQRHCHEG